MRKRFCSMFSGSSPWLLGQHGSCSSAQLPVELSENMLQNLFLSLPPHSVRTTSTFVNHTKDNQPHVAGCPTSRPPDRPTTHARENVGVFLSHRSRCGWFMQRESLVRISSPEQASVQPGRAKMNGRPLRMRPQVARMSRKASPHSQRYPAAATTQCDMGRPELWPARGPVGGILASVRR